MEGFHWFVELFSNSETHAAGEEVNRYNLPGRSFGSVLQKP